jgi:mono/diheme cytochrome c family protein
MKKWLFAMIFGSALVLGACGSSDDGAQEESDNNAEEPAENEGGTVDTAAAEELFESNCASCHGGDLSGGMGPDLTKVGSNHSADDIKDIIENGTGNMPAQKQVDEDDATTLADWLADHK